MSAAELSNQLSTLSESLKATNNLISRLAKLHLQPGSEPLEGDEGVRTELAQEIHTSLKELEDELEFLKQEAEDPQPGRAVRRRQSAKDTQETQLSAKSVRLGEELVHARQRFRNAQVTAKAASERAKQKEREALFEQYRKQADQLPATDIGGNDTERLFAGRSRRNQQQKQLSKDEILANASSDVTSALRRTHQLLSTELSRSRFAQETLDESTAALSSLGEEYGRLDNILSNSRNLLGTLLRSQKSDTWYLETAFYILIATLCWLFFRRILFGPFVKLPLFLWNVSAFLLKWIVFRPLIFLLSASGVLVSEPIASSVGGRIATSSRRPLIVQPSAKSGLSAFPEYVQDAIRSAGIPAGAGGAGAKEGIESTLAGQMSEQIGKMAEESDKQDRERAEGQGQSDHEKAKEPVRRGDGTILEERDQPANPKKKQFDTSLEDQKQRARKRDEL